MYIRDMLLTEMLEWPKSSTISVVSIMSYVRMLVRSQCS